MKPGRLLVAAVLLCVGAATEARAQVRTTAWGVTVHLTPAWIVSDYQKHLYDAEELEVRGTELSVGFVRGKTYEGHWGVSFEQRRVKGGSEVRLDSGRIRTADANAMLRGISIGGFAPISTIRERAQIGLTWGLGVAQWAGTFTERPAGENESPLTGRGLFPFLVDQEIVPTARLEVTGIWIVTPNLKALVSSGINLPGTNRVALGLIYLFGGS